MKIPAPGGEIAFSNWFLRISAAGQNPENGFFRAFFLKHVKPISTFANNKRFLPTNSTTPDRRLREGNRTTGEPYIAHTVQVHTWHLAQFGWRGPHWHLKCRGLAHTLSAASLSEVALRRTSTESIGGSPHLKPHLQKKKLSLHLAVSTLGGIYFLIYLPNYRKKMLQRRPRQPLLPHPIMMLRSLRMMS